MAEDVDDQLRATLAKAAAAKVLLIDGPMRGQMFDGPGSAAIYYQQPPQSLGEEPSEGAYRIGSYRLCGRKVLLGTIDPDSLTEQTLNDVFWTWLASEDALLVSELPVPQPAGQKEG
jgi:hypothetical protein